MRSFAKAGKSSALNTELPCGTKLSEGANEIVWRGGDLGDGEYDEFVFRGYLPSELKVGGMLYFPVIQGCPEGKVERRIEIPAAGQTDDDLELPAPTLELVKASYWKKEESQKMDNVRSKEVIEVWPGLVYGAEAASAAKAGNSLLPMLILGVALIVTGGTVVMAFV
ncbi:DUF1775 domain-containing protein [Mesorhizobium sp. ES1-3]|uniref:DUF1775 domain-containing protein n=1 Tax=Mesorhizobium sp. ES1-3 TaxID=2876628 RepID=UPI001CCA743B|nr:DUF1775 domain-containing protein [Mesorhizobium sp. ES1-3]MBZ9672873.1 YcnI family protein [Mesorhizobium sp. ES1-3]